MSSKMQLSYFCQIATNRNSYNGRMQAVLNFEVYHIFSDEQYISDSDKLFTVDFRAVESDVEDDNARKWFESHPKQWSEFAKGIRFDDWRLDKFTIASESSHLCNAIEKTTFALSAMNKIEKTINEYNLEAKFERRDIVSTWWSAMQKMKVEQLQYDRSRWRPIRTFPGYKVGQGHNICFDQILG